MIRLGRETDLDAVDRIVKETIIEMQSYGNDQWDETYPDTEVFRQDIALRNLYVCDRDNSCVAFICIDEHEPEPYKKVNWRYQEPCLIIHRLAVSIKYRGLKIATQLLTYAEELALSKNCNYLRVDTYSLNFSLHKFLTKQGYVKVGEMNFLGKPNLFYCYDKKIKKIASKIQRKP